MIKPLIFGLLMAIDLVGISFQDFDQYQNQFTKEEIEGKITTYLEKDPQIREFYRLTHEALIIGDLAHQTIDYTLCLKESSPVNKKLSTDRRVLRGAKIAIDPGHLGGPFACLEDRYISFSAQEAKTNQPINFNEGTLTYLTAIELKSLLQADGAEVFITRRQVGEGAVTENFFDWIQQRPDLWTAQEPLVNLFRDHYNRADLIARAEKINAFHPDITIIIHYNAHEAELEGDSKQHLTQSNYNMTFIPGAFGKGELSQPQNRYDFLRMIVSDQLEQSSLLSQKIAERFVQNLDVPLVKDGEKLPYLIRSCMKQKQGVYSRNLALTRLVRSPLCYGETLVQNNREECERLGTNDTEVAGIPCSNRVKQVAKAYYEGIKDYFESMH